MQEEAGYRLATELIAAPPHFEEAAKCRSCNQPFGVARYRHHCRGCGRSFCHVHSSGTKPLPRLGYLAPVRVCDDCYSKETEDEKAQRVAWTLARFRAYLDGHLIPYFDCAVDTNANKARRVIEGTIFAAKKVQTALPAEELPISTHLPTPSQSLW